MTKKKKNLAAFVAGAFRGNPFSGPLEPGINPRVGKTFWLGDPSFLLGPVGRGKKPAARARGLFPWLLALAGFGPGRGQPCRGLGKSWRGPWWFSSAPLYTPLALNGAFNQAPVLQARKPFQGAHPGFSVTPPNGWGKGTLGFRAAKGARSTQASFFWGFSGGRRTPFFSPLGGLGRRGGCRLASLKIVGGRPGPGLAPARPRMGPASGASGPAGPWCCCFFRQHLGFSFYRASRFPCWAGPNPPSILVFVGKVLGNAPNRRLLAGAGPPGGRGGPAYPVPARGLIPWGGPFCARFFHLWFSFARFWAFSLQNRWPAERFFRAVALPAFPGLAFRGGLPLAGWAGGAPFFLFGPLGEARGRAQVSLAGFFRPFARLYPPLRGQFELIRPAPAVQGAAKFSFWVCQGLKLVGQFRIPPLAKFLKKNPKELGFFVWALPSWLGIPTRF